MRAVIVKSSPVERLCVDSHAAQESGRKADSSSWLCREDFDRERLLDMDKRVGTVRRKTFAILAVSIAASAPWLGWWPLLFLLPAAAFFGAADALTPRVSRPEYLMFAAWIGSEITIAGAVALEGHRGITALSWLAIPVITLSSRFPMRGVVVGVAIATVLTLSVAFGVDAHAVIASPQLVLAPTALIISVAVLSTALMQSDIQHRSDAVIDQLTGMLNRKALAVRVRELAQQSEVTGEPVGVIVGDLDHFKQINDSHGHAAGDVVLKEVAYLLRKQLRAFDLAYRLGGEEFLILVPGSDLQRTAELAERLREGVADDPVSDGLWVTMSLGVGASGHEERFDYATVFSVADEALYQAKREGRNRVCVAQPEQSMLLSALSSDSHSPSGGASPALA
jgi:diguanylate cyclase (GGDEF)-like protein